MNLETIISIPGIVIICYVIGMICKASKLKDEYIPIICAIIGGVISVLLWIFNINFSTDLLTAIACGIISGLSATGINQIPVQLNKIKEVK